MRLQDQGRCLLDALRRRERCVRGPPSAFGGFERFPITRVDSIDGHSCMIAGRADRVDRPLLDPPRQPFFFTNTDTLWKATIENVLPSYFSKPAFLIPLRGIVTLIVSLPDGDVEPAIGPDV